MDDNNISPNFIKVRQELEELSTFTDTDHKILDEICNQITPLKETQKTSTESVNDTNVKEYVYKKTSELIESTMSIINSLQRTFSGTAADPKEILALASLVKSAAAALKNMNDVNLQIRQSETQKDIKQMEIDSGLIMQNGFKASVTNNYVIATREEMMDRLLDRIQTLSSGKKNLELPATSSTTTMDISESENKDSSPS